MSRSLDQTEDGTRQPAHLPPDADEDPPASVRSSRSHGGMCVSDQNPVLFCFSRLSLSDGLVRFCDPGSAAPEEKEGCRTGSAEQEVWSSNFSQQECLSERTSSQRSRWISRISGAERDPSENHSDQIYILNPLTVHLIQKAIRKRRAVDSGRR